MLTDTLSACVHQNLLFLLRNKYISKMQRLILLETSEREPFQFDTFSMKECISSILLGGIIPIFNTFKAFNFKEALNNGDIPIHAGLLLRIYAVLAGCPWSSEELR